MHAHTYTCMLHMHMHMHVHMYMCGESLLARVGRIEAAHGAHPQLGRERAWQHVRPARRRHQGGEHLCQRVARRVCGVRGGVTRHLGEERGGDSTPLRPSARAAAAAAAAVPGHERGVAAG